MIEDLFSKNLLCWRNLPLDHETEQILNDKFFLMVILLFLEEIFDEEPFNNRIEVCCVLPLSPPDSSVVSFHFIICLFSRPPQSLYWREVLSGNYYLLFLLLDSCGSFLMPLNNMPGSLSLRFFTRQLTGSHKPSFVSFINNLCTG